MSWELSSTLCHPMDCSMPGFPVPELAQTRVHWVSDAIQPSHLLLSPSPAFSLSQHQGFSQWVSSAHQVAMCISSLPSVTVHGGSPVMQLRLSVWAWIGLSFCLARGDHCSWGMFPSPNQWRAIWGKYESRWCQKPFFDGFLSHRESISIKSWEWVSVVWEKNLGDSTGALF